MNKFSYLISLKSGKVAKVRGKGHLHTDSGPPPDGTKLSNYSNLILHRASAAAEFAQKNVELNLAISSRISSVSPRNRSPPGGVSVCELWEFVHFDGGRLELILYLFRSFQI